MIRALTVWAVLVLVALVLTACEQEPSCEQRGGRLVHAGMTFMMVGKVMVPVTHWRCEGVRS